ncbi:MAG: hypothetical protein ABR902_03180 [Candidatus Korobacteraceae bacterium]
MKNHLEPRPEPTADEVCVRVTPEQAHLEKHHAGGPDRGGASEPRQDVLAEQKLDPEQKEGAKKNREAEPVYNRFRVTCTRFGVERAWRYRLA